MWAKLMRLGLLLLLAISLPALPAAHADTDLPTEISGGTWKSGHVQGIAIDTRKGFMYFSFTDLLVKTDLNGAVIGTVTGFTGHLGDLAFDERDGRVYGSLEYKAASAFYIAIIDVDQINQQNMDAEATGIVSTVYLREVVADYTADMNGDGKFDGDVAATADHRYGCSGIDGVAFGPAFGSRDGAPKLTVAYGIYSNNGRTDNDYQVLLQYDTANWRAYERPLTQRAPHTSGPQTPDGKFFVRTGNTTYGVQNLEFDSHTENWFLAVYPGKKPQFPNYPFFIIEAGAQPQRQDLAGQPQPEQGSVLPLAPGGLQDDRSGTRGWKFTAPYGLIALGDGRYYVATSSTSKSDGTTYQSGVAHLYHWTGNTPTPFEKIEG
ncbi:hypothetical protein [Nocardia brasiliensis]|uniref:hypothetical protein n=1 Tax=Nocardia brasiliensis TaxID=37326 RepID=UPI002456BBF7|nr:hypothetical protein [Nocardia brasiliensis]